MANWIAQPPLFYRMLFPEASWRIPRRGRKVVYLTFDDGPIPEVTNVRRNREVFEEVRRRGHSYGNHTMHHLQGIKECAVKYLRDITEADSFIDSTLFRPPHGIIYPRQARLIRSHYNIVMYDLVTRDYSKRLTGEQVLDNVKRYTRNGSIIVFHDSLRAEKNLRYALPRAIEWLKEQGYEFLPLPM